MNGGVTGEIGTGLLVLLGVAKSDTTADADYIAEKLAGLRLFADEAGKMNRDVSKAGGSLLVVSQFTLYGDCRKGRRPSFDAAAGPEHARELYEYLVAALKKKGLRVEQGMFQAHMSVHLTNDGPVTVICDSGKIF